MNKSYRGRLAPSPTGYLHLGHAYTFWTAQQRSQERSGTLVLRNEDIDAARSRVEFAEAILEDLAWLCIDWQEGYGKGGPHNPYSQSQRLAEYERAFERLRSLDLVYPCACSRQDVLRALSAPHDGNEEPIYPGTCRSHSSKLLKPPNSARVNWRFRVPKGAAVSFVDGRFGEQKFVHGEDFGDFVVWRHDNLPAYQLAVVVDDAEMEITEVVRGSDLLLSTARQMLLYEALALDVPGFYHCPIVCDDGGNRLAKRHQALAIRNLRQQGVSVLELRNSWRRSLDCADHELGASI